MSFPFPFAGIWSFPLWPASASVGSRSVDHLFLFELAVAAAMTLGIFGSIFYFAIKYRRRSPDERPRPIRGSIALETFWSVVPLLFMLVMFAWGAQIYYRYADPPKNSLQIYVIGKQWMWKMQHPDGQAEIDELHVPVGQPVQLIITSQDVIHSFFLPAFRIKRDAVPGMYTTEWFQATRPGTYHIFCAQYCGTNHSQMIGSVYVMKPADYEAWLAGTGRGESLAAAGEKLFTRMGCVNCHVINPRCPSLAGLYMKQVPLSDGRIVLADEAYLRESILDPGAKIVAGFPNIMPSFRGLVTEEGVLELIAYIRSLGTPALAGPGAGIGGGQQMGAAAGPGAVSAREERAREHTYPRHENPHTWQSGGSTEIQPRTGTEMETPEQ